MPVCNDNASNLNKLNMLVGNFILCLLLVKLVQDIDFTNILTNFGLL